MARLARRRTAPPPPPPGYLGLPIGTIARWAGAVGSLAVAVGLTLWLEHSSAWSGLRSAIESLDFDPSRATLILAWFAGVLLAVMATLLGGRPWIAALTATAFVAIIYVWPFGERLRQEVPTIFGLKETLQPGVLWHNQAVALGLALVAALVGAATADLVRRGAVGTAVLTWRTLLSHRLQLTPLFRLVGAGAITLTVITGLVLAAGVDAVLRYGPEHGVYLVPVPSATTLPVDPSHPSAPPEAIPAHGELLDQVYHSAAMGEDRHFLVYLPPTYGLKRAASRHYPVVYLLHGDPGGPSEWVQFGATNIFDAGIAAGAMAETILVMPDGNGHVTSATQWANRFDGRDRIEDTVLELVDVVDQGFRTIPDRAHRLVGGLSSGAFGAANLAARHPDTFGTAMSFSGYFVATGPVFGGSSSYIRVNSPYYIVQDEPSSRRVRFILVVGNRDPYYQQTNRAFASQLDRFGVPHDLNLLPGGHSADIWQEGLALAMARMAPDLSGTVRLPDGGKTHGIQF
jgi:enterochelin esterase-like enzyme